VALDAFEATYGPLVGATSQASRNVLVAQLIDSENRVAYAKRLVGARLEDSALRPDSGAFDPLKGAVLSARSGNHDEACWLVFLSVHFGNHRTFGWELSGRFYGRLGQGGAWDWPSVSADLSGMRAWLDNNQAALRAGGVGFGNHRKYESLRGHGDMGSGATIESYVDLVSGSHKAYFEAVSPLGATQQQRFAAIYDSLAVVRRFGRVARFDYLTMLGKLQLAPLIADSAHLDGSTGPLSGARLLIGGDPSSGLSARVLEERLATLHDALGVTFDVLEDALCNWQKRPNSYVRFRG
jgi:hypothetical protein